MTRDQALKHLIGDTDWQTAGGPLNSKTDQFSGREIRWDEIEMRWSRARPTVTLCLCPQVHQGIRIKAKLYRAGKMYKKWRMNADAAARLMLYYPPLGRWSVSVSRGCLICQRSSKRHSWREWWNPIGLVRWNSEGVEVSPGQLALRLISSYSLTLTLKEPD